MSNTSPKIDITSLFNTEYNTVIDLPFSKQTIRMREMVTEDQKAVLKQSQNFADKDYLMRKVGVVLNDLLERITEEIDFTSMTLQDKLYLLVVMRCITQGSDKSLAIKCPKCEKEIKFNYNLERFTKGVKERSPQVITRTTTEMRGYVFTTDSITIAEEIENDKLLSSKKFRDEYSDMDDEFISNITRLACAIKSVKTPQGQDINLTEYTIEDRFKFVMGMPTSILNPTSESMKETLKESFEILDDKFTVYCPLTECDGKEEITISIGDEGFFIQPSSS